MWQLMREGAEIAARSAALPWILGWRWFEHFSGTGPARFAAERPGWLLAAKVAIDELFFATELVAGARFPLLEARRIAGEAERAFEFYTQRGWLERPEAYHEVPPPLQATEVSDAAYRGLPYQHLRYESGYAPWDGEPGRDRWLGYAPNRTAHARLFRHAGPPRPWVVCLPGYRMGSLAIDVTGFRVAWLHRKLGLNVAIPVNPFHGPRRTGRRSGDGYLSGDFLDTIHAQAQTLWEARRLIAWLRRQGAPAVGIYGVSLGAFTSAMLASLESRLDCVIVGMPVVDFVHLLQWNTPRFLFQVTERLGFPWAKVSAVLRVISPLALLLRVDPQRCFLFGGTGDTLAPPSHASELRRHWGEPRSVMYQGSHASFLIEGDVRDLLVEALTRTGLLGSFARAA